MIQRYKKDYLQRLIEEFFSKFSELFNKNSDMNIEKKRQLINDGFNFFYTDLDVRQSDSPDVVVQKIADVSLLEQYVKLLLLKYELTDIKEREQLEAALDIIKYLENVDKTYSWDRTILREDILRYLDEAD